MTRRKSAASKYATGAVPACRRDVGHVLGSGTPLSWTDAWIFASLTATDRTELADLVARADVLNHAIPTVAEIQTALQRLYARGLIAVRSQGVSLTEAGRAVHARGTAARGGLFSVVDNMHKALRSRICPAPVPRRVRNAPARLGFVDVDSVARACAEYAQWVQSPSGTKAPSRR